MRPLHFLVTDDDAGKRLLLTIALSRAFPTASIYECPSGQEALDFFRSNAVDAIVTDHNMHPIDGLELVRTLRGANSKIPIIMVSGSPEIKPAAMEAGVDLFLDTEKLFFVAHYVEDLLRRRGIAV